MILSIVVLTGYAGQISLAQWALAGIGALIAGRLVRADVPIELAIVLGILLTIPVGLVFALPALRTRGVNLAVVTLGLGFLVSEVVFANPNYLGGRARRRHSDRPGEAVRYQGRRLQPPARLGGGEPRRASCSSRCSSPTSADRAPAAGSSRCERTSAPPRRSASRCSASSCTRSPCRAGLAAVAGILVGFQGQVITYTEFNIFASINSLGHAVIGGLGYVLGAVFGAPNAIGGIGTRIIEDWIGLKNQWDLIIGSLHPLRDPHRPPERHRRRRRPTTAGCGRSSTWSLAATSAAPLPPAEVEPVAGRDAVDRRPDRPLRLGGGGRRRVDGGPPGRGRRPDRAERRGEDDPHRRGDRLRAGQPADRSRSTVAASTG